MAKYEMSAGDLMAVKMVEGLGIEPGQPFTRQQAVEWFKTNYPLIDPLTVRCQLIRLSTNDPSRLHYSPKHGHDRFFRLEPGEYRLYEPGKDPRPIDDGSTKTPRVALKEVAEDGDEEEECFPSTEFAYERDLREYLAKNLGMIQSGLRLYQNEDAPEIRGIEFLAGSRRIDILAVDSKDYVVIELKVSRGYDRVVGQLARYMAWVKKNLAKQGQSVRGIIVCREMSEDIRLACSVVPNVLLFEYQLSVTLKQVTAD